MKDKNYKLILLDLDGTVTDPKTGITRSFTYALGKLGLNVPDTDSLARFIGPPIRQSFREGCGLDSERTELAIEFFREYFAETGIYENTLYPGMDGLLKRLVSSGKTLALATFKVTYYAELILKHFNILQYFSCVCGSTPDDDSLTKASVIKSAIAGCGAFEPENCVMVGDREHDIVAAKEAGVDSIGVLYGYGGYDELANAGAGLIVGTVEELASVLLS